MCTATVEGVDTAGSAGAGRQRDGAVLFVRVKQTANAVKLGNTNTDDNGKLLVKRLV